MSLGAALIGRVPRVALTSEPARVLVVGGDPAVRRKTATVLVRAGYDVTQASSCRTAWQSIARRRPHLILLDEALEGFRIEVGRRAETAPELGMIHISLVLGQDEAMTRVVARTSGSVDSIIARPFSDVTLLAHVKSMTSVQRHAAAVAAGRLDLVEARRAALSLMQDAEAQRQRAEDARERLETSTHGLRLLSRAIETSPVMVVIADRSGCIEYVNPQVTMVTGYAAEELVGNHTRIFKSGHHMPEFYVDLWATLGAGRRWQGEFFNRRKDRSLYWESASIAPVHDSAGTLTHFVAVKEDISPQRRALLELEEARCVANAASRAKSDFLASMSHELRTPLTAIIGFSQVLQDQTFGALNPKQSRYVNNILTAGGHLLGLINDILDLARVEAGRTELELSTIRLRTLLDDSVALIGEQALRKALTVHVGVPDDLVVVADERRLEQIVLNLLSNALKFTSEGGDIFLSAVRVGDEVQVTVRDTGCGIEFEDQARLFRPFEQLEAGYDRKHGGTGLGLALSRRLVELHGGRIWVVSPGRGAGTTFRFAIPVESHEVRVARARGEHE
jgi:PAS domain S-box-containing protein